MPKVVNDALDYIPRLTYMMTNQIACYKKSGDDVKFNFWRPCVDVIIAKASTLTIWYRILRE